MLVTRDVSKLVSGWLNEEALSNMPFMSVTRDVLKFVNGWLKEEARVNMPFMVVTWAVFQPDMLGLQVCLNKKSRLISVTREVSHVVMDLYFAFAAEAFASTAVWSPALPAKEYGTEVGTWVGVSVGVSVGVWVGLEGALVGTCVGELVGAVEGICVGADTSTLVSSSFSLSSMFARVAMEALRERSMSSKLGACTVASNSFFASS